MNTKGMLMGAVLCDVPQTLINTQSQFLLEAVFTLSSPEIHSPTFKQLIVLKCEDPEPKHVRFGKNHRVQRHRAFLHLITWRTLIDTDTQVSPQTIKTGALVPDPHQDNFKALLMILLPKTSWLKTIAIYSFIVLEARSLKSVSLRQKARCWQSCDPSGGSRVFQYLVALGIPSIRW